MQRRGLRRGARSWAMLPHCKPDDRLTHSKRHLIWWRPVQFSRASHPVARCKTGVPWHVQVELHAVARVDQGGGSRFEAVPHEVWCGEVGADPGDRAAAGEAHPAAERPGAAPARPAVPCRCCAAPDSSSIIYCHLQPSREQRLTCGVASRWWAVTLRLTAPLEKAVRMPWHGPAGCTGLLVDIDRIREDNERRTDVERKAGLIIWSGREWPLTMH